MIWAAIILTLVGACAALLFWAVAQAEKRKATEAEATAKAATLAAEMLEARLEGAEARIADGSRRYEAVIAGLKREIEELEKHNALFASNPAAVRARLRELLNSMPSILPVPDAAVTPSDRLPAVLPPGTPADD